MTDKGHTTGPRTPPASRICQIRYRFVWVWGYGHGTSWPQRFTTITPFLAGRGRARAWAADDLIELRKSKRLAVTRPEYDHGLCHFPDPNDNSQNEGLCGPNQPRRIAKSGGIVQLPDSTISHPSTTYITPMHVTVCLTLPRESSACCASNKVDILPSSPWTTRYDQYRTERLFPLLRPVPTRSRH